MAGMFDNGAGLLEKLNQLGRQKLLRMLPQAGAAVGSAMGGPVGGAAGYAGGMTIEALMNALGQGQQSPYAGTGRQPGMMGMQTQGAPSFAERFASNLGESGAQRLGDFGVDQLSNYLDGKGQEKEMSEEEIKEMLSKMSEEELMAYIEKKFGHQLGGQ